MKRQATLVRIAPSTHERIQEIVWSLKQRQQAQWSMNKIINCALLRFIDDFPRMSNRKLAALYAQSLKLNQEDEL